MNDMKGTQQLGGPDNIPAGGAGATGPTGIGNITRAGQEGTGEIKKRERETLLSQKPREWTPEEKGGEANKDGWGFFTQFGKGGRVFKVYIRGNRVRIQEDNRVLFEDSFLNMEYKERYRHVVEIYHSLENDEAKK